MLLKLHHTGRYQLEVSLRIAKGLRLFLEVAHDMRILGILAVIQLGISKRKVPAAAADK